MADIVVGGVIVLAVGLALWYVIKAKRSGKKCIGCPEGGCCSKAQCSACCSACHGDGHIEP